MLYFYQHKNPEAIKKMSKDTLQKLELSLSSLLDLIKTEGVLRNISKWVDPKSDPYTEIQTRNFQQEDKLPDVQYPEEFFNKSSTEAGNSIRSLLKKDKDGASTTTTTTTSTKPKKKELTIKNDEAFNAKTTNSNDNSTNFASVDINTGTKNYTPKGTTTGINLNSANKAPSSLKSGFHQTNKSLNSSNQIGDKKSEKLPVKNHTQMDVYTDSPDKNNKSMNKSPGKIKSEIDFGKNDVGYKQLNINLIPTTGKNVKYKEISLDKK